MIEIEKWWNNDGTTIEQRLNNDWTTWDFQMFTYVHKHLNNSIVACWTWPMLWIIRLPINLLSCTSLWWPKCFNPNHPVPCASMSGFGSHNSCNTFIILNWLTTFKKKGESWSYSSLYSNIKETKIQRHPRIQSTKVIHVFSVFSDHDRYWKLHSRKSRVPPTWTINTDFTYLPNFNAVSLYVHEAVASFMYFNNSLLSQQFICANGVPAGSREKPRETERNREEDSVLNDVKYRHTSSSFRKS